MKTTLIYGANGYTGALASANAIERGLSPILAGRNRDAIEKLGSRLNLPARVFSLGDRTAMSSALKDVHTVLHCAGPFSATARPMMDACIAAGVHYLDITGEISVFAAGHERHQRALEAGMVLMPGAGFDVVPTDCLAAQLARRLPGATHLILAFDGQGGPSPGTAKTGVEGLASGCMVREEGQMKRVPLAWKQRTIEFSHGPRAATTIPWGDVYTAHISTGIPNIEVYMAMPPATIRRIRKLRMFRPLLALGPVQRFMKSRIERKVPGPDDRRRESTQSYIYGEVSDCVGTRIAARMITPNGYTLTVATSLRIARFLQDYEGPGGYFTPSQFLGAGFIETIPGVSIEMLDG